MPKFTLQHLHGLAALALARSGASVDMARITAEALITAEAQGLASHGLSRVPQYAGHLRHGRVNGNAEPRILNSKPAACLIDADEGLAFPASAMAIREAIARAGEYGVAFVGVTRSHHFGVAAYHLEAVAKAGMVGFAFSNSPAAMPAWGGKRGIFGTNPIAAAFPRRNEPPLMIDMSLSEVARGKLMVAAKADKPIPLGWAVDKDGNPTTDAKAGMEGFMLPTGGVKGAMLALVVELLCCAMTGAAFGFEADSLFVDTGNRPHLGQAFLVIDPGALSGADVFYERMEALVAMMLLDPEVRLPGYRRMKLEKQAAAEGVEVAPAMIEQLEALGAAG